MISSDLGIVLNHKNEFASLLILKTPVKCICGCLTAIVINRNGKTLCTSCSSL